MARCSTCQAPILWTRTEAGKALPVDATDEDGVVAAIEDPDGNVIPTGDVEPGTTIPIVYVTGHLIEANQLFPPAHRWRPHFATCPDADRFRRKGAKTAPRPSDEPTGPYGRTDSIITPRHP